MGKRLKIIIDNSKEHGKPGSGENQAFEILKKSAGVDNVKRQKMGSLQHNKMIIIDGKEIKSAVGGSTNYSWRGFFVQSNNAVIVQGKAAIKPFLEAFNNYWKIKNEVKLFAATGSAKWNTLGLKGINAKVTFSPHNEGNSVINEIADDIGRSKSSLLFSLAFLNITPGVVRDAIIKIKKDNEVFCYGLTDKEVGGLELTKPDGKVTVVSPTALKKGLPGIFQKEVAGGGGNRMHHKFLVIDFNKPTARVYTGSYNFSIPADESNGENLWLIRDRRIATSYAVASLAMFDHYHFRTIQADAKKARKEIFLAKPPFTPGSKTWFDEDYKNERKILDRKLFS